MLHDIHVFLHENRFVVLVVAALGMVVAIRIFVAHFAAARQPVPAARPPGPLIRPQGKPSSKFAETVKAEDFPRSLDAGVAAHLDRGRAVTDKPAPVTVGGDKASSDDDAMSDLFSGLGDDTATVAKADAAKHDPTRSHSPKEATTERDRKAISETAAIRRVARLEEIGFHHSIPSDKVEPGRAPPMPVDVPSSTATTVVSPVDAAKARLQELGLAGGAAGGATAEAAKPAAPELDAILARIDQVLSQDQKKTEVDVRPASRSDARLRPTETLPPEPRRPDPRQAATQVLQPMPDPDAPKADAAKAETKKTTPLWARADAFDEDAEKTDAKKDDGQQLGLFDKDKG